MKAFILCSLILVPFTTQAKVYSPKDFAFDCHGTYVIASMSNVMIETRTVASRSPIPMTYEVAVAEISLEPKVVTADCSLLESKYQIPFHSLKAQITVKTSDANEIKKLVGTESDFSIEQFIYDTNAAGELPLFPKYAMSEWLQFKTPLDLETESFGKYDLEIDSEKVYGIKPVETMTFIDKVALAHQLHDEIVSANLDPEKDVPYFQLLMQTEPSSSTKQEVPLALTKEYFEVLLDTFQWATKQRVDLSKPTSGIGSDHEMTLLSIARKVNEFATYTFGSFSEPAVAAANAAYKMSFLKKTPMLFAHDVLFSGYEYTAHLSLSETEELVTEFAAQATSSLLSPIEQKQYLNALQAISDENLRSKNKFAPQYTLTAKAAAVIAQALAVKTVGI